MSKTKWCSQWDIECWSVFMSWVNLHIRPVKNIRWRINEACSTIKKLHLSVMHVFQFSQRIRSPQQTAERKRFQYRERNLTLKHWRCTWSTRSASTPNFPPKPLDVSVWEQCLDSLLWYSWPTADCWDKHIKQIILSTLQSYSIIRLSRLKKCKWRAVKEKRLTAVIIYILYCDLVKFTNITKVAFYKHKKKRRLL